MAKLYFYYSTMNAGKTTTLLQSAYVSVSRAEFKQITAGHGRIELQQFVLPLGAPDEAAAALPGSNSDDGQRS